MTVGHENWHSVHCFHSFLVLRAFTSSIRDAVQSQSQILFLSRLWWLPAPVLAHFVQDLPFGESATEPSAISAALIGRSNSSYWHYVDHSDGIRWIFASLHCCGTSTSPHFMDPGDRLTGVHKVVCFLSQSPSEPARGSSGWALQCGTLMHPAPSHSDFLGPSPTLACLY